MYKLLVAEGSEVYFDSMQELFQKEFDLRMCSDGEAALELLESFQPDALIINVMLPFKDGLTVLQETPFKPKVILALSHFMSDYIQDAAEELGVQFLTVMPKLSTIRVRLMDMIATTIAPKEDLGAQTAVLLHSLNFTPNLDGYQQLCFAIPMYAQQPGIRLSKELYPRIAEEFHLADPRTVEHSIRKAIANAWMHFNPAVWSKFFTPDETGMPPCPSNKEFISRVAEFIEL